MPSLVFSHLTKADGLLSEIHNHVYKDSKGFVWLSSSQGLQRYDGHHFVNYLEAEMTVSASGLPGVVAVVEDRHNNIIASTSEGIYVKHARSPRFVPVDIMPAPDGDTVPHTYVGHFVKDNAGSVWFINAPWLCRMTDDAKVQPVAPVRGAPSYGFSWTECDNRGRIWFTEEGHGFRAFDPATLDFVDEGEEPLLVALNDLTLDPLPDRLVFTETHLLFYHIWFARLTAIDLKTFAITDLTLPGSSDKSQLAKRVLSSAVRDSRDNVWVALHQHEGLIRISDNLQKVELLMPNNSDPLSLHDDVYIGMSGGQVFIDDEDRIWYEGLRGINTCRPYAQPYRYFTNAGLLLTTTTMPTANGFYTAPDGRVFVAYYGTGLVEYSNNLTEKSVYPLTVDGAEVDAVWTVFSPDGRHVLAPTQHRATMEVDMTTGALRALTGGVFALRQINCSYVQDDTTVWLGHFRKGFSRWNYTTGAFVNYDSIVFPKALNAITVRSIAAPSGRRIWIFGDYSDALLFDPASQQVVRRVPIAGPSIPTPRGNSVQGGDASASHLYFATPKGLIVYELATGAYALYTKAQGLADNNCFAVLVDSIHKCVWITTGRGLSRFDPVTRAIHNYAAITAPADNRGDIAIALLPDSSVLYSVASGFIQLMPHSASVTGRPADVRITGMTIAGAHVNLDSLADSRIRLGPDQRQVTIAFSAMTMPDNPGITYEVLLEGADKAWTNIGHTASMEYHNLSPGSYSFRVRAVNVNGELGRETVLAFVIKPYFWTTAWFWGLIALAVGGGGYLALRANHRRKQKQAVAESKLKHQLQEAENLALRAQMNPHFIFNCLNSINLFIADNNRDAATQYLSRFAKLIRLILDNSANELIPLSKELEALQLYIGMEELRFENKFEHRVQVADDVNPDTAQVPPLLIQPFVENAIWHGLMLQEKDPKLDVTVERTNGSVVIRIDDNGIGREKSGAIRKQSVLTRRSIGMQLAKNRLEHLNTQLGANAHYTVIDKTNGNGKSAGTRVEIVLPLIVTNP